MELILLKGVPLKLFNQHTSKYTLPQVASIEPIKITAIILSFICPVGMAFEPKPIQRLLLDMRATNQFRVRLAPESTMYSIASICSTWHTQTKGGESGRAHMFVLPSICISRAHVKRSAPAHMCCIYIHVCNYQLASPFNS